MVTCLTTEQERMLAKQAAARGMSAPEALDELLAQTPPTDTLTRRRWTEEELRYLSGQSSNKSLALKFGRTPAAIANKRLKMRKSHAVT